MTWWPVDLITIDCMVYLSAKQTCKSYVMCPSMSLLRLSSKWHSEWVTKWPNDQVTGDRVIKWPNDQVTELPSTKWQDDRKLRRRLTGWYIFLFQRFPTSLAYRPMKLWLAILKFLTEMRVSLQRKCPRRVGYSWTQELPIWLSSRWRRRCLTPPSCCPRVSTVMAVIANLT